MIHKYRWQPDTCACVVEETHDDSTDTWTGRVPTTQGFGKCIAHAKISDATLYDLLREENSGKNLVHGKAREVGTRIVSPQEKEALRLLHRVNNNSHHSPVEIPDEIFHPDKGIDWRFDEDRHLHFTLTGFTEEEKAAVHSESLKVIGKRITLHIH